LQLISDKIQIIRFYLSLIRSVAYGKSEVKLFACKEIANRWEFSFSNGEKWFDKLFNVKYLPLFHHFKAIYQFPKHIIVLVKIVANAPLITCIYFYNAINKKKQEKKPSIFKHIYIMRRNILNIYE
jgi:hypothetical protein